MARPSRRRGSSSGSRGYDRTDRLGELLREIVAEELDRIDDERLELVTITGVDVDRELERARIFYTSLGRDERDPEITAALAEQRRRLKKALGAQAHVRRVPELVFTPDETIRSAERIEQIIRDLHDGDEPHGDERDGAREDDGESR
jgi:ribosome-binding factor A